MRTCRPDGGSHLDLSVFYSPRSEIIQIWAIIRGVFRGRGKGCVSSSPSLSLSCSHVLSLSLTLVHYIPLYHAHSLSISRSLTLLLSLSVSVSLSQLALYLLIALTNTCSLSISCTRYLSHTHNLFYSLRNKPSNFRRISLWMFQGWMTSKVLLDHYITVMSLFCQTSNVICKFINIS